MAIILDVLFLLYKPLKIVREIRNGDWCISNYWFEQILADSKFHAEEPAICTLHPFNFYFRPVLPRLLVLNDAVKVNDDYREGVSRYQDCMKTLIKHHQVAILRVNEESDIESEVLAAMQAME